MKPTPETDHGKQLDWLVGRRSVLRGALLCTIGLSGCLDSEGTGGGGFGVSSTVIGDGEPIPTRYTCDGENVSPAFQFTSVPEEAESFALVVDDPDAPTADPFVHWLLWNVPPDTQRLPRDVPNTATVESLGGARQGRNDADTVGYTGPCPPREDGAHTYRFIVYAVDSVLGVEAGSERSALDSALMDKVLGRVTLTGTYDRN